MITASTSLHQTQVSTANKLRNSPLSFSMSLSPGAASSASVASSVGGDSVATGASVGRSATPSPERPSPVSNHHHPHDLSSYSINRRPGSAHSPGVVRGSSSPGPVPARAGESHSAHSALQASLGLCQLITSLSSPSFPPLASYYYRFTSSVTKLIDLTC